MKQYDIVKADLKVDREEIMMLLKRNLDMVSEERYNWSYLGYPRKEVQCWLARDIVSGKMVGTGALFPRQVFLNGQVFMAGVVGDFAVERAHRGYGPAFQLQRAILSWAREGNIQFIYGVPNELSERLFLRIGYRELGGYNRYVKILKIEYKTGKSILHLPTGNRSSSIFDYGLRRFSRERRYRRPSSIDVEFPEEFDSRFDRLWAEVSRDFKFLGVRDSTFLNWRYKLSPFQDYKIFTIVRTRGDIVGYIVYYIRENVAYIADILFLPSEKILDALLSEFSLYMRGKGIGSISIRYLGGKFLTGKLREFNFIRDWRNRTKVLIYVDKDLSPISDIIEQENWHFLEGDNDI